MKCKTNKENLHKICVFSESSDSYKDSFGERDNQRESHLEDKVDTAEMRTTAYYLIITKISISLIKIKFEGNIVFFIAF